jgi:rubrerythrin
MNIRHDRGGDELRRQLREFGQHSAASQRSQRRVFRALLHSDASSDTRVESLFGRRQLFGLGGLAVASGAVLAACAYDAGEPGSVGIGDAPEEAPDVLVNDVVLLRTASSLEHVAIDVYQLALDAGVLPGAVADVAKRFQADHRQHAEAFETLTSEFGGQPFTCANPKIWSALIDPVWKRITEGTEATDAAKAIPPSDDPTLDALNVAHALESIAGSTYQALVSAFSQPQLRRDAMEVGKVEARHAALLALAINPGGYLPVDAAEAPAVTTTTVADTIPKDVNTTAPAGGDEPAPVAEDRLVPVALPGAFGNLGALLLVVGAGDENGVRLKINVETPSLNSFVYESITCE